MSLISDTSPLNYLVLIDAIHIIPKLYGFVTIPPSVLAELTSRFAPVKVREYFSDLPIWMDIAEAGTPTADLSAFDLHPGERDVLTLAFASENSLILMDESEGRRAAYAISRNVIGTLGLLKQAHSHGLILLPSTIKSLRATNFRMSKRLEDELLR